MRPLAGLRLDEAARLARGRRLEATDGRLGGLESVAWRGRPRGLGAGRPGDRLGGGAGEAEAGIEGMESHLVPPVGNRGAVVAVIAGRGWRLVEVEQFAEVAGVVGQLRPIRDPH